jgi:HK97 gp10 family phage protein
MASAVSFKVTGFDALQKQFTKLDKVVQEEVVEEIVSFGQDVALKAKSRAPKDLGYLAQSTNAQIIPNGVQIFSNAKYAPYVEFGTGAKVDVPQGLEQYAIQFKGKGIKQVNLKARPFFFNSYFEERPKFLKRLKELFKL